MCVHPLVCMYTGRGSFECTTNIKPQEISQFQVVHRCTNVYPSHIATYTVNIDITVCALEVCEVDGLVTYTHVDIHAIGLQIV